MNANHKFNQEIYKHIDDLGVVATPEFRITGKSGYTHKFDFQIMTKEKQILIKTVKTLPGKTLKRIILSCIDVMTSATKRTDVIVIVKSKPVWQSWGVICCDKMARAGIEYVRWSEENEPERDDLSNMLKENI